MDTNKIQADLAKINQAIEAQEALRGTLPAADIEANLATLRQKQTALMAQLGQTGLTGSGAVAQGSGATAVGERGVSVGGDVGGSIITGDQGSVGGIQAHTIKADNVVQGMQQLGGDLTNAAQAVALAEALQGGRISADSIEAKNVVAGFQYIADPAQATPDELRQEVAALKEQLAAALAAGEVAATADVADAQEALDKAENELAQEQPQGNRVVRKLKEASEILTEGAKAADSAKNIGLKLIQLAPIAAALYQIAVKLFGG
jgi:hypothetical protein